MLRGFAERLTHRIVVRRRLPDEFDRAPIFVSSEGGLRYLTKSMNEVSPELLSAAQSVVEEGSVVWDVGANVGLFSAAAATLAGRSGSVLAIEPDVWLVRLLRRTAKFQGNMEVLSVAVSDNVGVENLIVAQRSRSTNYLTGHGSTQTGGVREAEVVVTVTLDWLLEQFAAPDVVKIDVEGAELRALQGASLLLDNCRPTIVCEVRGEHRSDVLDLLASSGYAFEQVTEMDLIARPT